NVESVDKPHPMHNAGRVRVTYTYDALDRRTKVEQPLGAEIVLGAGVPPINENRVRIETRSLYDAQDNLAFVYDPANNPSDAYFNSFGQRLWLTSPGFKMTIFQYDRAGNLRQVTDPGRLVTTYKYNAHNQPTERRDASRTEGRLVTTYDYDDAGNL